LDKPEQEAQVPLREESPQLFNRRLSLTLKGWHLNRNSGCEICWGVLFTEDLARDRSDANIWEEGPSRRGVSETEGLERGFLDGESAVKVGRDSERAPELCENGKQSQAFSSDGLSLERNLQSEVRRGEAHGRNSLSESELNNRRTVKHDVRKCSDPSMCRDASESIHTTEVQVKQPRGNVHPENEPVESELGVARIGSHADGFRGFEREVDKLRLAEGGPSWITAEPSRFLGQSSRPQGGPRGALAGAHEMHPRSAERVPKEGKLSKADFWTVAI
jgi:hypothetical protein